MRLDYLWIILEAYIISSLAKRMWIGIRKIGKGNLGGNIVGGLTDVSSKYFSSLCTIDSINDSLVSCGSD